MKQTNNHLWVPQEFHQITAVSWWKSIFTACLRIVQILYVFINSVATIQFTKNLNNLEYLIKKTTRLWCTETLPGSNNNILYNYGYSTLLFSPYSLTTASQNICYCRFICSKLTWQISGLKQENIILRSPPYLSTTSKMVSRYKFKSVGWYSS